MPTRNLIDPKNQKELLPFAHFDVLAAMLCPTAQLRPARQRIADTIRRENGLRAFQRGALSNSASWTIIKRGFFRGSASGYHFNTLLDAAHRDNPPTLNRAIVCIQDQLPESKDGGKSDGSSPGQNLELYRRSPRILRSQFLEFGSVAHFWGAFIHGEELANLYRDGNKSVLPTSIDRLPLFLAYAEAHLSVYRQLPIKRSDAAFVRHFWEFKIPDTLQRSITLGPARAG